MGRVNWKETGIKMAGTFVGIAAGSAARKYISGSNTVSGLFGGNTAKDYFVPGVLAAVGAVVSATCKDEFIKAVGFGATSANGAAIVNQLVGRELVTLKGLGNTMPGMGGMRGIGCNGMGVINRIPRRVPQKVSGLDSINAMPGMSGGVSGTLPGMGGVGIL